MSPKTPSFADVAEALGARHTDRETVLVKCPAHQDSRESLSISRGSKGQEVLINCHAGCTFDQIISAMSPEVRRMILPPREVVSNKNKSKIVAIYDYRDEEDNLLFQVCRHEPKRFTQRQPLGDGTDDRWVYNVRNVRAVLYRLSEVRQAIKDGTDIFLCEGEKDVETLREMGFVATTNASGATNFARSLLDQLYGARKIFIVEDNDDAGRARTDKLVSMMAKAGTAKYIYRISFPELDVHHDVTDWFHWFALLGGAAREQFQLDKINGAELLYDSTLALDEQRLMAQAREEAQRQRAEEKKAQSEAKREEKKIVAEQGDASIRDDYVNFALSLFPEHRRELLSDRLMFRVPGEEEWYAAADVMPVIRSEARTFEKRFTPLIAFEDHLEHYRLKQKKRLLIDIPAWDGVSRLDEMGSLFRFRGIDGSMWAELMKEWGANIFRRMSDNTIQPICPIIIGPQGCGKDQLIRALCGGLEGYFKNLDLSQRDPEEAKRQLHTALVFNIPEFDRSAKTEVAALKNLLNTPDTDTRLKFDRSDRKRKVRASFIASVNIRDILMDSTGARRYWVFEAEYLGFKIVETANGKLVGGELEQDYPGLFNRRDMHEERLQILAEFKELAERGYRASKEAHQRIRELTDEMVPDDVNENLVSDFCEALRELEVNGKTPGAYRSFDEAPGFSVQDCDSIFDKLCREYGFSRPKVQRLLKLHGLQFRDKQSRYYTYVKPGTVVRGARCPF